jgi:hypothetical protein
MYIPRNNLRKPPTLAKRCVLCGRFLFERNLKENERYHKLGRYYVCHQCFIKIERERIENEQTETKLVGEPQQTT